MRSLVAVQKTEGSLKERFGSFSNYCIGYERGGNVRSYDSSLRDLSSHQV